MRPQDHFSNLTEYQQRTLDDIETWDEFGHWYDYKGTSTLPGPGCPIQVIYYAKDGFLGGIPTKGAPTTIRIGTTRMIGVGYALQIPPTLQVGNTAPHAVQPGEVPMLQTDTPQALDYLRAARNILAHQTDNPCHQKIADVLRHIYDMMRTGSPAFKIGPIATELDTLVVQLWEELLGDQGHAKLVSGPFNSVEEMQEDARRRQEESGDDRFPF